MLSKLTIVLALASLASAVTGPALARFHLAPPMLGAALFLLGGLLGLAAVGLAVVAAVRLEAYLPALIGSLGMLPLLAVTATIAQGARYPAINDITTTPDAPPTFEAAATLPDNTGRDLSFPPDFAAIIREHYPDLAPLSLDRNPDLAYRMARDMASQPPFNWTIVRDDPEAREFEAVVETRLFRWKDDVAVRVEPDDAGGSLVHMRSKSREGQGDLGANARRIRDFFAELADH